MLSRRQLQGSVRCDSDWNSFFFLTVEAPLLNEETSTVCFRLLPEVEAGPEKRAHISGKTLPLRKRKSGNRGT